jgi:hypothetical protein
MVLFDHGTSLAAVCTLPRVEIVKEFEDWIVVALLTPTEQIIFKIQAIMFKDPTMFEFILGNSY